MKAINRKTLWITVLVCLLPILVGVAVWESLPEMMAIHFNVYNEADNFMPKGFVVFGLPCLMAAFQIFSCVVSDCSSKKQAEKMTLVSKWILPVVTVTLYFATLGYGLGWKIDIRMVAAVLVGGMFLVTGNYLPKLSYVKNYRLDTEKARKINRFIGFLTVVLGILFLGSIFLPPIATVVCVFLLIPYAIVGMIYGIVVTKSKKN